MTMNEKILTRINERILYNRKMGKQAEFSLRRFRDATRKWLLRNGDKYDNNHQPELYQKLTHNAHKFLGKGYEYTAFQNWLDKTLFQPMFYVY